MSRLYKTVTDFIRYFEYASNRSKYGLPRPRSFDAECVLRLDMLGSFDSLVASVLWAALAEEIASPELRASALRPI